MARPRRWRHESARTRHSIALRQPASRLAPVVLGQEFVADLGARERPTIGDDRPNTQFKAAQGPVTIGFAEIGGREAIDGTAARDLACNISEQCNNSQRLLCRGTYSHLALNKEVAKNASISGPPILAIQDVERPLSTCIGRNTL